MSDSKITSGNEEQESQGSSPEQEEYVPRKSYEEVARDMHKYKSTLRETKAKLSEYEAMLKQREDEKLKEQQRWQELYEKEKSEREKVYQERQREKDLYLRAVKLSALKAELGGKIRDEYLSHAKIESIELGEDGAIKADTVREVANLFRQEHPTLVPQAGGSNITSSTPPADGIPTNNVDINQLSREQKIALLLEMEKQSKNQ